MGADFDAILSLGRHRLADVRCGTVRAIVVADSNVADGFDAVAGGSENFQDLVGCVAIAGDDPHNQAGDLDQYTRYLRLAVEQNPQSAPLHLQLGNAYQEAEKYTEAVTQWRMVLDLEPDHPKRLDLLNQMARAGKPTTTP